jgi:hypothetical protein
MEPVGYFLSCKILNLVLSEMNLCPYIFKICFNVALPCASRSPWWLDPPGFLANIFSSFNFSHLCCIGISGPAPWHTQPPVLFVSLALYPALNLWERENNQSSQSSVEEKNPWIFTSTVNERTESKRMFCKYFKEYTFNTKQQYVICDLSLPRRSQWPHSLKHELSSLVWKLGSWVRIPLKVWMSVCVYAVFMLYCV